MKVNYEIMSTQFGQYTTSPDGQYIEFDVHEPGSTQVIHLTLTRQEFDAAGERKVSPVGGFDKALADTLHSEGGYSDDPDDKGKETYAGITRKNFPNWPGWALVDRSKPLKTGQKVSDNNMPALLANFYRANFWDRIKGDQINDQKVAGFLFDWMVNSGAVAVRKLQALVNADADGQVGPATLKAVNEYKDQRILFEALKTARIEFVKAIVRHDPSQKEFLSGWLNRIMSFK